jgi:hypothetical protein
MCAPAGQLRVHSCQAIEDCADSSARLFSTDVWGSGTSHDVQTGSSVSAAAGLTPPLHRVQGAKGEAGCIAVAAAYSICYCSSWFVLHIVQCIIVDCLRLLFNAVWCLLVNITAVTMPGGLQLLTQTTTCGPKRWAISSAAMGDGIADRRCIFLRLQRR